MNTKTITTATAKDLVKRWVESHRLLNEPVRCHVDNIYAQLEALAEVKLSPEETEQLYSWVCERASTIVGVPSFVADTIGGDLGLSQSEAAALLLAAERWDKDHKH